MSCLCFLSMGVIIACLYSGGTIPVVSEFLKIVVKGMDIDGAIIFIKGSGNGSCGDVELEFANNVWIRLLEGGWNSVRYWLIKVEWSIDILCILCWLLLNVLHRIFILSTKYLEKLLHSILSGISGRTLSFDFPSKELVIP